MMLLWMAGIDHVILAGFMAKGSCISPTVASLRQTGRRAMLWGRSLGTCTPSRTAYNTRSMAGLIATLRTEGFTLKYAME